MESKSKKGEKIENKDDKPELAWVETVLGEMKNEFNKQLSFASYKTDYGSKKNSASSASTKKLDTRKAESAKGANKEGKKSAPSHKSGGSKSSTGKSVHSKPGTSKTSNTKQHSKQVVIVKPLPVKQATTKSTSSSPVAERVSKNASTRKSAVLTGTDSSSKGYTKKQDRITTAPSATTTKRGTPSTVSADKKSDKKCDVNMGGNHLSGIKQNVCKAVSDKLTVAPVVAAVFNTGDKMSVESSTTVIPETTRTKAVTVSDMIRSNSRTVTTPISNTAAASKSTLRVTSTTRHAAAAAAAAVLSQPALLMCSTLVPLVMAVPPSSVQALPLHLVYKPL
ncbi:location of vulva defective 1-like [Schistocerca nitens]|uniref:location of vulva defective 1-like n=1 Tax=Schistocerca nitens TaxID=7011 RepID=UPI002118A875|nr:location of vulva defective 1-like [Schistocerca nitens]